MDESEQDKSEQPTSFKLASARRKGTVARGMDLGFLTGLVAFTGCAWIAGPQFAATLAHGARGALIGAFGLADGQASLMGIAGLLFSLAVRPLLYLVGAIFLIVLLFELLQTGVVFSGEPLKPDFSRINPAKGLKRLFSWRLLIETVKNVLKLAAYGTVGWLVVREALHSDVGFARDAESLSGLMAAVAFRLLVAFVLVALFFAVVDQMIVRRDFFKKMRMSRRELRREHREREGEPRLKQKRKQLHGEFAKLSESLRNLRSADILITNPTHIALALRYDPASMQAPIVVSIGVNGFAQRLKRLAFLYAVPIIEDRALARAILGSCGLNSPIPEHCFQPVANIYNALRGKAGGGESGRGYV